MNDKINEEFGTSSTSSICGTTSAYAYYMWWYHWDGQRYETSPIATVSTSTGVPVITI
jgi:hypothetical protein